MVLSDRDFPTHVAWGAWPRCSTLSSVTLKKGKEKDGRHALGDTPRVASLDQVCQTSFSFLPPHHNPTHFVRATARAPTCPRKGGGGRWRRLRERRVAARGHLVSDGVAREQAMLRQRLNRRQPSDSCRESKRPAFGRRGPSRRKSSRGGSRRGGAGPAPGAARSRTLQFEDPLIRGESLASRRDSWRGRIYGNRQFYDR